MSAPGSGAARLDARKSVAKNIEDGAALIASGFEVQALRAHAPVTARRSWAGCPLLALHEAHELSLPLQCCTDCVADARRHRVLRAVSLEFDDLVSFLAEASID